MKKRKWIVSLALALTMLAGCTGYKTPTFDNPQRMSADTLCYRYAYAKENRALAEEIKNRNLDCEANLQDQGPLGESRW